MFSSLADSLDKSFRNLRGVGKISEKNIADALREVRMALLEADVEFSVAKDFIARVKEKAQGAEVLKSIKPGEQIVKIFQDELTELLGGDQAPINLNPPAHVLLCGLNGAGKTTTAAKLAYRLKKEGRRPLLVALDLYRPAAIDQLAKLAEQADVPCFTPDPGETNLVKTAKRALKWAKEQNGTLVIFDTAGRQELDDNLVSELQKLHKFLDPGETLLVADSATGQQAVSVAQTFDEKIGITGLVLTKLDGDARGGAALSMRAITGKPIKFIGEGEKLENLAEFHPNRMADRILGMGDIVSMVETVADKIDEKKAMKSAKRMQSGKFDFNDFLDQMKMIRSLGPLDGILGMLPGFNKIKKSIPTGALDDKRMKQMEAIVLSMTKKERAKPVIIKGPRRKRIANGSGTTVLQVNQLLKQFGQMQKMMKSKRQNERNDETTRRHGRTRRRKRGATCPTWAISEDSSAEAKAAPNSPSKNNHQPSLSNHLFQTDSGIDKIPVLSRKTRKPKGLIQQSPGQSEERAAPWVSPPGNTRTLKGRPNRSLLRSPSSGTTTNPGPPAATAFFREHENPLSLSTSHFTINGMGIFSKPPLRGGKKKDNLPDDLWTKCPDCGEMSHTLDLRQHHLVCPHCDHHFLLGARDRIELLADPDTFEETDARLISTNPLGFSNYAEKNAAPPGKNPAQRRRPHRQARDRRAPGHGRRHGFQILRRIDGIGGGRKTHPRHRDGHCRKTGRHHLLRLLRCPDAGRDALAHADGKNLRGPLPPRRCRASLHFHHDPPPPRAASPRPSPPSAISTWPSPSA